jgi:hypothetical protein
MLLALGVDISTLEEAYGICESTLRTWLSRSGDHGQKLHQRLLIGLDLVHVQLDELPTALNVFGSVGRGETRQA